MGKIWSLIRNREFRWKSTYFRRNFVLILIIASIPGIITGIGLYCFGIHNIEKELKTIHENQITERANNVHEQLEYLEISLAHWAFDPMYNYSLLEVDFKKEFQTTRDISKSLLILEGSNPIVDKVEFYLDLEEPILFNPHYNEVASIKELQFYQGLLEHENSINWEYYNIPTPNGQSNEYLTLTHHIPGISKPIFGEIIIKINQEKFSQLFETLTPYDEGATILLDEKQEILLTTNGADELPFTKEILAETLDQETQQDSFSVELDEMTYLVSYGFMERVSGDWMYISASPISSITSPIVFISKLILVISFSGMLLAIIMSWFASIRIYHPVKKLIHGLNHEEQSLSRDKDEFELIRNNLFNVMSESRRLEKRLAEQMPQLKESLLVQISKGYYDQFPEEKLRQRMQNYGWELEHQQIILLDIQLTGLYSSEQVFEESDYSLLTFTLVNIVEEFATHYFKQFTVMNYHNLSMGMLVVYPETENGQSQVHAFAEKTSEMINKLIKMHVTTTISTPVQEVKKIAHLFEEVKIGKKYRKFENKNQVINLEKWTKDKDGFTIFYPFDTEKEIIQSIRRGQVEESKQLIYHFINELKGNGIQEINIQPGVIQLFSVIHHEILQSGIHPSELFKGRNMFDELTEIRELDWMVHWIVKEVIEPYVKILRSRIDMEMKQTVEQVVQYLEENYMNDISLESCAEIVGVNAYSLSKSFKKVLHINFIDYLTNLRINKAKELLLNTERKISDIAESVGYRHSYFNRIFKKHVGLPPSQYRKMKS
ncbi:AraC family transcriptional regulator [Gracilibacillus alcaliphilus]|uniref:AraC family transcriptional regulator n=1 Tax=Gracilibacillus alcaliphilus TaxID=1401441 RepID=UPI00195E43A7|nr:AraC family transcriptional regulator [Gracilibacillus alcaliphilus]MBM7677440.1 YesN/AraC family two-component response regulator [Gracilibacillus alcaliphilus]